MPDGRALRRLRGAFLLIVVSATACSGGGVGLGKQYEYEEEVYLALDGQATVIVNASIPALVALHGFEAALDPAARVDREAIRAFYESSVTRVTRVSRPWRRQGRRFVQVRVEVADIRRAHLAPPFAWSTYSLGEEDGLAVFRQRIAVPERRAVEGVGWGGADLVAIRLHLPAKIQYHNAPSKAIERGNILVWEQSLAERRAGVPLEIDVRMQRQTILYTTLIVFGIAVGAALVLLGLVVMWVRRRGRAMRA